MKETTRELLSELKKLQAEEERQSSLDSLKQAKDQLNKLEISLRLGEIDYVGIKMHIETGSLDLNDDVVLDEDKIKKEITSAKFLKALRKLKDVMEELKEEGEL